MIKKGLFAVAFILVLLTGAVTWAEKMPGTVPGTTPVPMEKPCPIMVGDWDTITDDAHYEYTTSAPGYKLGAKGIAHITNAIKRPQGCLFYGTLEVPGNPIDNALITGALLNNNEVTMTTLNSNNGAHVSILHGVLTETIAPTAAAVIKRPTINYTINNFRTGIIVNTGFGTAVKR